MVAAQAAAPTAVVVFPAAHTLQLAEPAAGWKVPTRHGKQNRAPDDGWYWPGVQAAHGVTPPLNMPAVQVELQLEEPAVEISPEGHAVQTPEDVAPTAGEKYPLGQLPPANLNVASQGLPTRQLAHMSPVLPGPV